MIRDTENEILIIRKIMRDKRVSVSQLAQMIGISQSTMSQTLSKTNVNVSSLRAIAEALGVEIADLFAVPANYQHYSIRNDGPKEDEVMGVVRQNQTLDGGLAQDCTGGSKPTTMRTMFCPKCGTKFLVEDVH